MSETPDPSKVRIEYIKSTAFRVTHVDGAIGGMSPRLDLFVTFYTERFPIPKVLVYKATPQGAPGEELESERETKAGIIREAEVAITMDLPTAKAFALWLNEKIVELEKTRQRILSPTEHRLATEHSEEVKG
jgi:hypothetical protein